MIKDTNNKKATETEIKEIYGCFSDYIFFSAYYIRRYNEYHYNKWRRISDTKTTKIIQYFYYIFKRNDIYDTLNNELDFYEKDFSEIRQWVVNNKTPNLTSFDLQAIRTVLQYSTEDIILWINLNRLLNQSYFYEGSIIEVYFEVILNNISIDDILCDGRILEDFSHEMELDYLDFVVGILGDADFKNYVPFLEHTSKLYDYFHYEIGEAEKLWRLWHTIPSSCLSFTEVLKLESEDEISYNLEKTEHGTYLVLNED